MKLFLSHQSQQLIVKWTINLYKNFTSKPTIDTAQYVMGQAIHVLAVHEVFQITKEYEVVQQAGHKKQYIQHTNSGILQWLQQMRIVDRAEIDD